MAKTNTSRANDWSSPISALLEAVRRAQRAWVWWRTPERAPLVLGSCRTPRQSYPARWKRVPLEKLLGREVRSQPLIADRCDVPHLDVFIPMRPVLRPDDASRPGFARSGRRPLGCDHLVDSKPADLLAITKRQPHLRSPCRALNELLEDLRAT